MSSYVKDVQFDLIVPGVRAASKGQVFLNLAQNAADFLNISEKTMLERVTKREGSINSGIGNGIAIPHFKMRRIHKPFTMLMTLESPIRQETPDSIPVDIYCLLISPEKDGPIHLRRLSRLSRMMNNQTLHKRIRETQDRDLIRSLLSNPEGWLMAA